MAAAATSEKLIVHRLLFRLILYTFLASSCISVLVRFGRPKIVAIGDRVVAKNSVRDADKYVPLIDSFSPRTEPSFIVLLTCSDGFFEMWLNWLAFFERLGIPNLPVHLFAEDQKTYKRCMNQTSSRNRDSLVDEYFADVVCLSWEVVFPDEEAEARIGAKNYRSGGYKVMMSHRPPIVLRELKMGRNVIFSDVDTVWNENPLPYFSQNFPSTNVWAQRDGEKNGRDFLCPGFMVYRSCPETIEFVDMWRSSIEGKRMRNQKAFNSLLLEVEANNTFNMVVKTLPPERFAFGDLYFKEMTDAERSKVVVVHNNGMAHYSNKVERMKLFGLWAV